MQSLNSLSTNKGTDTRTRGTVTVSEDEGFLEYEEELKLSALLVKRREVLDRIETNNEELKNQSDIETVKAGDEAAKELVNRYMPHIRLRAWKIYRAKVNLQKSGNAIEIDDLINVGYEAALKCTNRFNAGGKSVQLEDGTWEHRNGLRFASYAGQHIQREILRYMDRGSTPFRVNVDALQRTYVVKGTQAELREQRGKAPSEEEVESKTGINMDYVRGYLDMPPRSGMVDVDEVEVAQRTQSVSDTVASALSSDQATFDLERLLDKGGQLPNDVIDILLSLSGVDIGIPRNTQEMGKHLGLTRKSSYWQAYAYDMLRHPMTRVRIAKMYQQMQDERDQAN